MKTLAMDPLKSPALVWKYCKCSCNLMCILRRLSSPSLMSDPAWTDTSHIKIQNQLSEDLICFPDTSTLIHHGRCSLWVFGEMLKAPCSFLDSSVFPICPHKFPWCLSKQLMAFQVDRKKTNKIFFPFFLRWQGVDRWICHCQNTETMCYS